MKVQSVSVRDRRAEVESLLILVPHQRPAIGRGTLQRNELVGRCALRHNSKRQEQPAQRRCAWTYARGGARGWAESRSASWGVIASVHGASTRRTAEPGRRTRASSDSMPPATLPQARRQAKAQQASRVADGAPPAVGHRRRRPARSKERPSGRARRHKPGHAPEAEGQDGGLQQERPSHDEGNAILVSAQPPHGPIVNRQGRSRQSPHCPTGGMARLV